jgi:hypothetical protein
LVADEKRRRRDDQTQPRNPIRMDSYDVPTSAVTYATISKSGAPTLRWRQCRSTRKRDASWKA